MIVLKLLLFYFCLRLEFFNSSIFYVFNFMRPNLVLMMEFICCWVFRMRVSRSLPVKNLYCFGSIVNLVNPEWQLKLLKL